MSVPPGDNSDVENAFQMLNVRITMHEDPQSGYSFYDTTWGDLLISTMTPQQIRQAKRGFSNCLCCPAHRIKTPMARIITPNYESLHKCNCSCRHHYRQLDIID